MDEAISVADSRAVLASAELLYDKATVEQAITRLGAAISDELQHTTPLLLPVMIGGLVLAGKLLPQLGFPLRVDYAQAARYHGTAGGRLRWLKRPAGPLKDQTVLLIDDILDQGVTLAALIDYCRASGARRVCTAVLAEKQRQRREGLPKADFSGLAVPDRYVFGYGMDYHGFHRNLDGIYALGPTP